MVGVRRAVGRGGGLPERADLGGLGQARPGAGLQRGHGIGDRLIPVERSSQGSGVVGKGLSEPAEIAAMRDRGGLTRGNAPHRMVHLPGTFADTLAVLAVALGIEAAAGYPDALYRAAGHPVTWIGRLITALGARPQPRLGAPAGVAGCSRWRCPHRGRLGALAVRRWRGSPAPSPSALLGLLGASLPAQRSLHQHVAAVETALRAGGLGPGAGPWR